MFTSRAEYRLLLDIDSADLRLTEHGHSLGLIGEARYARFLERKERARRYTELLQSTELNPTTEVVKRGRAALGIEITEPTTPARLLRRSDVTPEGIERLLGDEIPASMTKGERRSIENRLRYAGYIERQERDLLRLRREEGRRIPDGFDFAGVSGLSGEVVEKLSRARPESLAQASRISGVTPAALTLINVYLEKLRRSAFISRTYHEHQHRRTDTPYSAESSSLPSTGSRPARRRRPDSRPDQEATTADTHSGR